MESTSHIANSPQSPPPHPWGRSMLVNSKMTRDVITASPITTLASALEITREHRIRHLPIVDNGKLVGLISDRDLRLATPPVWASDHAELLSALQTRTVGEHMVT